MTTTQLNYFNSMVPGQILDVSQVKNPIQFIRAAKDYIDQCGLLEFNNEYTQVTKLNPFPANGGISFYFD